ncbi:YbjN domain-containing protein [Desulfoluna sp.]|uniref:YbjN domain-containing protein n=1 Tax=Desulfoluna sp. TaxID=2045199 RepID=UPI0026394C26|nr:YbjN domain-containing protein [Desulfoluna sp.]
MQSEMITADNLSPELLKSVFDSAFMEATMENGGDITVQEAVKVRVKVNERKNRIRFMSVFGFKENAKQAAQLECVNLINSEYIMVCASAEENLLFFRYDLGVVGGLTKKALVMAVKQFAEIPHQAVTDHGQELVD